MSIADVAPRRERAGNRYNPARVATAGAFLSALALAADSVASSRERKKLTSSVEMVHTSGSGDQSIYVLPGCRSDGRFVAEHLGEAMQPLGDTHGVVYPAQQFPIDQVRQQLLETRRSERDRTASFYALSMGGLVLSHLLSDAEFRQEFGPIETVIFDSSPSGTADLSRHSHQAMRLAATLPTSYAVSKLYGHAMRHSAAKHDHNPHMSDVLREHIRSTASTPLGAVAAQTRFIRDRRFATGELAEAGKMIDQMFYISSGNDDVINVWQAAENYEKLYQTRIDHIVDSARETPSHAAGVEHPELVREFLRSPEPIELAASDVPQHQAAA